MTVRAADHRDNTSVRRGPTLPSALAGLAVCHAVILYVMRRMRKKVFAQIPAACRQAWRLGPSGSLAACRRLHCIRCRRPRLGHTETYRGRSR